MCCCPRKHPHTPFFFQISIYFLSLFLYFFNSNFFHIFWYTDRLVEFVFSAWMNIKRFLFSKTHDRKIFSENLV